MDGDGDHNVIQILTNGSNESSTSNYSTGDDDVSTTYALYNADMGFFYQDIAALEDSWTNEPHFVPVVTVYSIASVLGIVGNALVIFAMVGDRKSRSVTRSFMVSLAVADLLFLLVCVPHETSKFFTGRWGIGAVMCKMSGLVGMLTPMATVLNLLAVSVERYVVIVHPMNARSWCSVENTKKILPVLWLLAFALSCPCLYVWNTEEDHFYNNETSVTLSMCFDAISNHDRLVFASYQLAVMFVVPVIVLTFCYVFVIDVLWTSSMQLKEMTYTSSSYTIMSNDPNRESTATYNPSTYEEQPPTSSTRHSHIRSRRSMLNRVTREHSAEVLKARKQVIKMLVAIIVVFFVCWGPKLTFNLLLRLEMTWTHYQWALNLKIFLFILPFVHSCLNPIVYGFMSRNFRSRLATAFRSLALCRKTHPKESVVDKKTMAGSYYELESRSTNGTVHTKISLRQGSCSNSDS